VKEIPVETLSGRLARFAAALRFEDIPSQVIGKIFVYIKGIVGFLEQIYFFIFGQNGFFSGHARTSSNNFIDFLEKPINEIISL